MLKYDHPMLASMREEGMSWSEIAGRLGATEKQIRQAHNRWKNRNVEETHDGLPVVQKWLRTDEGTIHVKVPQGADDPAEIERIWDEAREDFELWQPAKQISTFSEPSIGMDDPCLAVVSMNDAHLGMRSWEAETSQPSQDLETLSGDYSYVSSQIFHTSRIYPVQRYLLIVGSDFLHADTYQGKVPTTTSGTPQDVDGRLSKVFKRARRLLVEQVDLFRQRGCPVDVLFVRGNHDEKSVGMLGLVIDSWYRQDEQVNVIVPDGTRSYYGFGRNAFMLHHGHDAKKKDAPLVFATECPAEIWVASKNGAREILSGHFHARETSTHGSVYETRAIVSRTLPALCSTDAWHANGGGAYLHKRASTLLVYKESGGMMALHEVTP